MTYSLHTPLLEYARAIQTELRAHQVRCELAGSSDHVKAKISSAEQMKVHTNARDRKPRPRKRGDQRANTAKATSAPNAG